MYGLALQCDYCNAVGFIEREMRDDELVPHGWVAVQAFFGELPGSWGHKHICPKCAAERLKL